MDAFQENTTSLYLYEYDNLGDVKVQPLISDDVKIILEYTNQIALFSTLGIFGIIANTINIIIYKKQGLGDSITLNFFALSVSDFFVAGIPIGMAICYGLRFLYPDSNVDFRSILYVSFGSTRRFAYSMTCSFTMLLSLERCVCVVFPFHVKRIFHETRAKIFLWVISACHLILFVPLLATNELRWQKTPSRNDSMVLRLWLAPSHAVLQRVMKIVSSIVIPVVSQVIVTCCAIIMARGLRKSASFRQTASNSTKASRGNSKMEQKDGGSNLNSCYDQRNTKTRANGENNTRVSLSQRDAKLVRTVVFIAIIFSLCNFPDVAYTFILMAEPKLNLNKAYHNTYSFTYSCIYVLASFNACANIFIYYNTSTKYKKIFDGIFRRKAK